MANPSPGPTILICQLLSLQVKPTDHTQNTSSPCEWHFLYKTVAKYLSGCYQQLSQLINQYSFARYVTPKLNQLQWSRAKFSFIKASKKAFTNSYLILPFWLCLLIMLV